MTAIKFLAFLCLASMTVLPMGDGQCISYCKGRDGRNGRDGRDGVNGRDGRDVCFETLGKPSIHLDGTTHKSIPFVANKDIDIWNASGANGYVSGGIMYANGQITVPVAGIYFVYCQVYYTQPNKAGRHGIIVNNRQVALAGTSGIPTSGTYYTGLSLKLNKGDKISCRLAYDSNLWSGMEHTFLGAFLQ
ncbi:lymphotoxin-alpha-like [Actinia tenebrosa]|uniref:Lymphotoxin-alpha-like n=1 Tax=Actinia tenebrosa TaxID=6105 RepID=A0A6P8HGK8_ACTTE|nr:lymphotoxin-alpha-like [Actinia tenebrosa]